MQRSVSLNNYINIHHILLLRLFYSKSVPNQYQIGPSWRGEQAGSTKMWARSGGPQRGCEPDWRREQPDHHYLVPVATPLSYMASAPLQNGHGEFLLPLHS
jgi:hypothetical protein